MDAKRTNTLRKQRLNSQGWGLTVTEGLWSQEGDTELVGLEVGLRGWHRVRSGSGDRAPARGVACFGLFRGVRLPQVT